VGSGVATCPVAPDLSLLHTLQERIHVLRK
jgi:hypothetical protein